jgi:hypothetical protein
VETVRRVIAPLDLDETTMGAVWVGLAKARLVRSVEEVEVRPLGEVPDRARQGLHPPAVAVGVGLNEPGRDHGAEQSPLAMDKGGGVNRKPADRTAAHPEFHCRSRLGRRQVGLVQLLHSLNVSAGQGGRVTTNDQQRVALLLVVARQPSRDGRGCPGR